MTGGEYGKIFKRAWGDADFKALTCQQQLLYLKLVSQRRPRARGGEPAGLTVSVTMIATSPRTRG